MFYPRLARSLAALVLLYGLFNVLTGAYVASIEPQEAREAAQARYLSSRSSGQAIDRGFYALILAAALGTLAEIARKRPE